MIPVLVFIAGLLVGSGAAYVAEAIMARRRVEIPHCPYCGVVLPPSQWLTALAFLVGPRRCTRCEKPLRWQRVVGELFLAVTWALVVVHYGLESRAILALVALIPLAMVMVTDLEAKLIPNRIMLPAIGVMLLVGAVVGPALPGISTAQWWHVPLGGAIGFLVFWVLALLGNAVFGEGALGAGDVKLSAYVGLVVGFPFVILALVLTFIFGFLGAVAVLIARRGSLRTAVPYGPYLVLGGAVTLLYGIEILVWYFQ
ncbi:MAG: prepilin peptidase [Anaerolineae bacterium]|nr:prepilin peptidase [Anaerolineae bacterium]